MHFSLEPLLFCRHPDHWRWY